MPSSTLNYEDDNNFKIPPLDIKFVPIPKTRLKSFQKTFTGYTDGLVKSVPGGMVTFQGYAENADKIYRITPRKDDVWLLTFPKTGTTWVSEMLWLIKNDCDFETALKTSLSKRAFFPEMAYFIPGLVSNKAGPCVQIDRMPSPRVIKPHLPFYLLHPNLLDTSKVVYVTRNPKDVIVSFYYHHKLMKGQGCEASIDEFAQFFMDDEVIYTPFFPHVLDAWRKRNHPNMHFVFYEDLKRDLKGELKKMAFFLGKELSEDQLDRLKEHLQFENIQKNETVNMEEMRKIGFLNDGGQFIRKGKVGDWKNHFSPEMNKKIDAWIEKNLAGTDLKFVTELDQQD